MHDFVKYLKFFFLILIFAAQLPVSSVWANTSRQGDFYMATGTYKGSSLARSITGLGFSPNIVIIKGDNTEYAVWRSDAMSGDSTAYFSNGVANFTGGITSLDSDGFTIGTHATVNSSSAVYYYTAFGHSGNSDIKTGSYTGNETDSRSITNVGFEPDLVWIKRDGTSTATWRSTALTGDNSSFFGLTAETANHVQALEPDGFQVGANARVNANGSTYYYAAFKNVSSQIATGSYTGDGADDRNVTGVGFKPELVWIKDSSITNNARFKPASLASDKTSQFGSGANVANVIQALQNDGFQVGSAASVNTSGSTYRWVAFNDINDTPNTPFLPQVTLWNVRGNANTWNSTFGSYVRDGDFVQIVNGNCGSTLNTDTAISSYNTVSSYLASLGRQNLTFGIYTSDLDNVQSVATATTNTSGISYIAYGYEPGCGDEFPADVSFPDSTGWVFSNALSSVTTAKNYASNAGKGLMVVPTGRPLLHPDLAAYNWDYTQLISSAGASYVLVQTQTWVSQGIFKDAVDELNYQINKGSVSKSLIRPQVTVDPDANPNVNGVDATTAFNASQTAQSRGFYTMSMWYDLGDTASATSYLNSVSTLNSSQILGPSSLVDGSFTTDSTPTLQFYVSDPNPSDTVKFRIQIDDNSDFSSPVIDYTSALAAQGAANFTVGQAVGSGSYATGSSGQTLTDGSYYWRVRTADNNGESSAYTSANQGGVAFQYATPPTRKPISSIAPAAINNLAAGTTTVASVELLWTSPSDDDSLVNTAASYDMRYGQTIITEANWDFMTKVMGEPTPILAGTKQSMTVSGLNTSTTYYFALSSLDEMGNVSALSNVLSAATMPIPPKNKIDLQQIDLQQEEKVQPTATTTVFSEDAVPSLIRIADREEVYVIAGNKKRHIPNAEAFIREGYNWEDITLVDDAHAAGFKTANLLRVIGDVKVYIVGRGMKRHIPNPESFNAANYRWEDIVELSASELSGYKEARFIRAIDDFKVYLLEGITKRWVKTAQVFNKRGYNWNEVIDINRVELDSYTTGSTITE